MGCASLILHPEGGRGSRSDLPSPSPLLGMLPKLEDVGRWPAGMGAGAPKHFPGSSPARHPHSHQQIAGNAPLRTVPHTRLAFRPF